jgi:hypothetical protein
MIVTLPFMSFNAIVSPFGVGPENSGAGDPIASFWFVVI